MLRYPKNQANEALAPNFWNSAQDFPCGKLLVISPVVGGKKVGEAKEGAGDAEPPMCPHHASFAQVSVSTDLIFLGLGALLAS